MKNQSSRTEFKQQELSLFLRSQIITAKTEEFTYIDTYAGKGFYDLSPQLRVPGSPVQVYLTLGLDDKIKTEIPNFKYNGFLYERNRKNYASLNKALDEVQSEYLVKHNFQAFRKSNREISLIPGDSIYKKGIVYFDPPGLLPVEVVKPYAKTFPNYSILCNLQRNSIVRWLSRLSYNPVKELSLLRSDWLISKPVERLGWCWLYGFNSEEEAKLILDYSIKANPYLQLFSLKSEAGQYCFKLMTEVGHHITKKRL